MLAPPPPYDANGIVTPHDHVAILDDDVLIRGVHASQVPSGRLSSAAFKSSTKCDPYFGMSVNLERISPAGSLSSYAFFAKLPASLPRGLGLLWV